MIRTLEPELLDELPADHPGAIDSRRDLRLLNTLMDHASVFAKSLKQLFPHHPPSRILEIGAGDGELLLRVAHRWIKSQHNHPPKSTSQFLPLPEGEGRGEGEGSASPQRPATVDVLFIDQQNLIRNDTKSAFAAFNWRVRSVEADIFDWLNESSEKSDVVLANLFLHHFTHDQLSLLFSALAKRTNALIAVEPRRSRWPLFCAQLLSLIGCNAVTCHDAPVSVRAGFKGRELSALWPRDGEWELTERRAGLFSHLFIARQKSGP